MASKKDIYNTRLQSYHKKLDKYQKLYDTKMNKFNDDNKLMWNKFTQGYTEYLNSNFKIK